MKSIIIYATKYGSVEKTAKMLKTKMKGEVVLVNIMKEDVPSLNLYDNVILGASVYAGRIQKKLTKYITENLPLLLEKRIGLFLCAAQKEPDLRVKQLKDVFPTELYNHAVCKETLGYEIYFEKLNFFEKIIMRVIKGDKESCSEISEANIKNFAKVIWSK